MKIIGNKRGLFLAVLILFAFGCTGRPSMSVMPVSTPGSSQTSSGTYTPEQQAPEPVVSMVFVEDTDGTDDGVRRLIRSMQSRGLDFYQTPSSPGGLIASGDVVLLKINCQWAERGGTNTDLLRGVIQAILDHQRFPWGNHCG